MGGGVGGRGGREGLSHCVDILCENSIYSSPVIITQFPVSHMHGHARPNSPCINRSSSHLTSEGTSS